MRFENLPTDKVRPNPRQPREGFPREDLKELAQSIKSLGIIQPIIVHEHRGGFRIIAGERRWRAVQLAGLHEVPAIVKENHRDEMDVLMESLVENLHRRDLESHERENALLELWKSKKWKTQDQLAKMISKSPAWITENIKAAEIRTRARVSQKVSTRAIADTAGLEEKEREKILRKIEAGTLKPTKVRKVAEMVKHAPKPVREEILKEKGGLSPIMAEKVLQLPDQKTQSQILDEIKRYDYTEKQLEARVEEIRVAKRKGLPIPVPEAAETPTEAGEYLVEELRQITERILAVPVTRFQGLSRKQLQVIQDMIQDIENQLTEWKRIIRTNQFR